MQSLALAVASGRPLWNQFAVKQGRAVHLDYEQGRRLTQDRYQRIARSMGIALAGLPANAFGVSCLPKGRLSDDSAEDSIVRICEGASVCVVDAFRGAFPKAKENDSEARCWLDMLQQASERSGCAMLVIMHSRKASDDTDVRTALRGSSALFDAAQTVYMLDGAPKKPTKVHNTKDRILGESRDMFGLTIEDEVDPVTGSERWGLDVSYMHTAEVQARYSVKDEEPDGSNIMTNHDSLMTLVGRVMHFVQCSGPNGAVLGAIAMTMGRSKSDVSVALVEACRNGGLRCEGKGASAVYFG